MRYEYVILEKPEDMQEVDFLNEQGQAGWDLIQKADCRSSRIEPPGYYFKRTIEISAKLRKIQTGEEDKCETDATKKTQTEIL